MKVSVSPLKSTGLWLESSRKNWMVSNRVSLISLYKTVVGSFINLYPGGALKVNENKICSRIPLTIEPSTQSHFR